MIDAKLLAGYARLRGLDALIARDPASAQAAQTTAQGAAARAAQSILPAATLAPLLTRGAQPGDASTAFTGAARLAASLPRAEPADIAPRTALDVGRTASAEVATRLRDDLQLSGLFYESHLAEWVAGSRDTAALRREPQAQWSTPQTRAPDAQGAQPSTASGSAAAPAVAHAGPAPRDVPGAEAALRVAADPAAAKASDAAPSTATTSATGTEAVTGSAAPAADTPLLRPEARDMVAQQLAVLEQRRVAWSGEAWPGQQVAIAFEEDPETQGGAASMRAWTVRIATTLPELGRMESTLRLQGGTLSITVAADDPQALDRLQAARAAFDAALVSAGIDVADILLARHAP